MINVKMGVEIVKAEFPASREFIEFLGKNLVHMQKDYDDAKALYVVRTPVCLINVYEGEYVGYLGKEVYQVYTEAEVDDLTGPMNGEVDISDEEYEAWYKANITNPTQFIVEVPRGKEEVLEIDGMTVCTRSEYILRDIHNKKSLTSILKDPSDFYTTVVHTFRADLTTEEYDALIARCKNVEATVTSRKGPDKKIHKASGV